MPMIKTHLNSSVRTEIEVKLIGVGDAHINSSASWDVATATNLGDKEVKLVITYFLIYCILKMLINYF